MKIAVDARFVGKSGIGTYIENVVFNMLKNRPEHEYLLIVDAQCRMSWPDNVEVMICDIPPFSIKEMFFFPVSKINKCDVFYSPYINLPFGLKIPVYTTIHDVLFLDVDGLASFVGRFARKCFLWNAVRRSNAVFTVSKFSEGRIRHHFRNATNVVVTYCGVPSKVIAYEKNIIPKKDYFIFVGNVKAHKGLSVLVDAFNKAKKEGLSSKLYIVGDNKNFRTKDESFNRKISSSADIVFTGFISDRELLNMVCCAKALILPSFYEGFGLPPLEALYLGTNVILSDIDVFKEIYAELPVTFFESGNVEHLKKCIMNATETMENADCVREKIAQKYNFANVAEVIQQQITLHE